MNKILAYMAVYILSAMIGSAEVKKSISAAADPYLPFIDPANPRGGLSLEIIRAALEYQGYEIKYENVPWARADKGVGEGTYDILPDAWINEKRQKTQIYSHSYAVNNLKFIKRKGDKFEYNGIASLSGKNIGTIRSYIYSKAFNSASDFKREETNSLISNIRKLIAGRIDLTLEDEIVAKSFIKMSDPELLTFIEFTKNTLSSNSLHISCGKKNPECRNIIRAFNKGLQKIKADGTYNRILRSYGLK